MPTQENTLLFPELSIADAEVSLDQLIAVVLQGRQVKIYSAPDWLAKLGIYPAKDNLLNANWCLAY